jgi:hypothetical protein
MRYHHRPFRRFQSGFNSRESLAYSIKFTIATHETHCQVNEGHQLNNIWSVLASTYVFTMIGNISSSFVHIMTGNTPECLKIHPL